MKYLKKFNENSQSDSKSILEYGFRILIRNTHLVGDQVNSNMDKFLSNLDIDKLESKFGRIVKFLGAGVFGSVFELDNDKVMKITFDFHEAPFLYRYCRGTEGLVEIDEIFKINFGETFAYIIVRDPIEVIEHGEYEGEKELSKNAMYKISPEWRGTHSDNFGIQNNKVVLYDGFCKKSEVDETEVPFLEL